MVVFLKDFFKKVNFAKSRQMHEKLPRMQSSYIQHKTVTHLGFLQDLSNYSQLVPGSVGPVALSTAPESSQTRLEHRDPSAAVWPVWL